MCVLIVTSDLIVHEAILGLDFVEEHKCLIDCSRKLLAFPRDGSSVQIQCRPSSHTAAVIGETVGLFTAEKVVVPPGSEMELMVKQTSGATGGTWFVESDTSSRLGVMVARGLVCPNRNGLVPVRVLNPRDEEVIVLKGVHLAKMELIDDDCTFTVSAISKNSNLSQEDQSTLWKMVCESGNYTSDDEKEQLLALLMEYSDVFSLSSSGLGRTTVTKHHINTGDAQPVHLLPRRIPQARREEVKRLIHEMLDQGAIQHSDSPWSSPVVLVKKKDGSTRFCIDYRKVNEVTRKDAYPLPRVDDTLETLVGSKYFSTLDLASGYWQVEVAENDQPKTAFTTPEGLFQFRVMPFGLCNAPATFQRLMDRVLSDLKWSTCLVYFDDIMVVGKSFADHLSNIGSVLARLRRAGLKLKPRKCHLCQKRVAFLGHIVSAEGIATDPSKTDAVAQWPTPQSRREVQQFLGLANYYRRFVKNFASIAKPLQRLTEKNSNFDWNIECQNAFDKLRACLISPPVLSYPDYSRRFILDTDASDVGIGAVLSQIRDDGSEVVVSYASRSLSRPEQRYCVTRKELLAVVEFIHHFRQYLLGREFTLRTDHGSLVWVRNFREPEGQLARWLQKLEEYTFTIIHRRGTLHSNADAMSRIPCRQCGRENHTEDIVDEEVTTLGVVIPRPLSHTPDDMAQHQLEDDYIQPVYHAVKSGHSPPPNIVRAWSRESRLLAQQWKSLLIKKGVLWRRKLGGNENDLQLVLPAKFHSDVLQCLHEGALSAHLGEEKMLCQLKERFYWPGSADDVKDWCATCQTCCTRKSAAPKKRAGLQTIGAGYPLQVVSVDIMGPLPETDSGSKYVLVAVDYFTRWVEAYGIPNQEATTVARKLVDEMFCRFSPPEQLHSDQGRQFESELVKEVCKLLGVKKTRTTPYHPQGNGMVERFNRTLLDMLSTTVGNHPASWEQNIRKVCLAYNSSVHSSTGYSPFFLMFGRQVKLPVDLMYGTGEVAEVPVPAYVQRLKEALREAYALVRDRCDTEHRRQKALYDEKVHGKPFERGDLVWLHSPAVPRGQSRKLHRPWKGPFKVEERLGDSTYKIKGPRSKKYQVVHFDRLKSCPPNVRIDEEHAPQNRPVRPADMPVRVQTRGGNMQLVDPDDSPVQMPEPEPVEPRAPGEQLVDPDDRPPQIPEPGPVEPRLVRIAPAEPPRPNDGARVEAPRRYPTRERRQTDFFGPYVTH